MDRVKSFVNKNKNDINFTNFSNTFQSFKSKVSNYAFNNNTKEQNNSEIVGSRSVRTVSSSNGSRPTNFVRNFSSNFFSNKENVNTNNFSSNSTKAFSNLNAKDVSKVSAFAANHPSIAKRGLQAAAYASGDKEMAKKIGQTSSKDIASTATKINKGANFVVENQDKIDEFNNTMDKLNRGGGGDKSNGSSPVNKFVNSSAISNSSSNSGTHYNLPKRSSTIATVPSGGSGGGASKISAPPPLPGRINNDVHITRNNSTSSTGSTPRGEKIVRSNTVGSNSANTTNYNTNNPIPSTTKFNKPPPPPVPKHKPDLDKMTEVITSSASNTTSRSVNGPPPLPHRPSASKLKKSDSDSKLFNEGNELKGKPIGRGNTQPNSHAPGIKTQSYNNDCANEITRDFNISMPPDNISRYSNVFIQVAENNVVTDSTVKTLWMQSGIPKSVLAKIWSFVNRKLDGLLEKSEFIVGMYIIDQYLNGYDIEYYFMDQ